MKLLTLDNNYDNGSSYLSKTDDGNDICTSILFINFSCKICYVLCFINLFEDGVVYKLSRY